MSSLDIQRSQCKTCRKPVSQGMFTKRLVPKGYTIDKLGFCSCIGCVFCGDRFPDTINTNQEPRPGQYIPVHEEGMRKRRRPNDNSRPKREERPRCFTCRDAACVGCFRDFLERHCNCIHLQPPPACCKLPVGLKRLKGFVTKEVYRSLRNRLALKSDYWRIPCPAPGCPALIPTRKFHKAFNVDVILGRTGLKHAFRRSRIVRCPRAKCSQIICTLCYRPFHGFHTPCKDPTLQDHDQGLESTTGPSLESSIDGQDYNGRDDGDDDGGSKEGPDERGSSSGHQRGSEHINRPTENNNQSRLDSCEGSYDVLPDGHQTLANGYRGHHEGYNGLTNGHSNHSALTDGHQTLTNGHQGRNETHTRLVNGHPALNNRRLTLAQGYDESINDYHARANGHQTITNGYQALMVERQAHHEGRNGLPNGHNIPTNGYQASTNGHQGYEEWVDRLINSHNVQTIKHQAMTNGHTGYNEGYTGSTNGYSTLVDRRLISAQAYGEFEFEFVDEDQGLANGHQSHNEGHDRLTNGHNYNHNTLTIGSQTLMNGHHGHDEGPNRLINGHHNRLYMHGSQLDRLSEHMSEEVDSEPHDDESSLDDSEESEREDFQQTLYAINTLGRRGRASPEEDKGSSSSNEDDSPQDNSDEANFRQIQYETNTLGRRRTTTLGENEELVSPHIQRVDETEYVIASFGRSTDDEGPLWPDFDDEAPDDWALAEEIFPLRTVQCLRCRSLLSRNRGCHFIRCPCGLGFCYNCGIVMEKHEAHNTGYNTPHDRVCVRSWQVDLPLRRTGARLIVGDDGVDAAGMRGREFCGYPFDHPLAEMHDDEMRLREFLEIQHRNRQMIQAQDAWKAEKETMNREIVFGKIFLFADSIFA